MKKIIQLTLLVSAITTTTSYCWWLEKIRSADLYDLPKDRQRSNAPNRLQSWYQNWQQERQIREQKRQDYKEIYKEPYKRLSTTYPRVYLTPENLPYTKNILRERKLWYTTLANRPFPDEDIQREAAIASSRLADIKLLILYNRLPQSNLYNKYFSYIAKQGWGQ